MDSGQKTDISNGDSDVLEPYNYATDFTVLQNFSDNVAVPSLESIAIVNVVVQLWKHEDFREEITQHVLKLICIRGCCYRRVRLHNFVEISKKISEMPVFLSLPNLLKEKARSVIRPIGGEMMHWLGQFQTCRWHYKPGTELLDTVCFTMKGTIDKAKSLERMLGKVKLGDIFDKACKYCLEDFVTSIWKQMPDETRESSSYACDVFQGYDRHLIAYWTCFMRNELSKLMSMIEPRDIYSCNDSIYRNMFTLSVTKGKALAAKYFWNKLTDGERNGSVVEWTCSVMEKRQTHKDNNKERSDLVFFFYYLNCMTKSSKRKLLRKYGAVVLRSLFLNWPWQKTFLQPAIQSLWKYLNRDVYIRVLKEILEEMRLFKTDVQLFRILWCNTPRSFRKHFIQYIVIQNNSIVDGDGYVCVFGRELLFDLLDIEDEEPIHLVLNDADDEEKKRIVSSTVESEILYTLMHREKISLLDEFIGEHLTTECEIKKFKANKMLEYGGSLCCHFMSGNNWQAFEKMLEWGFDSRDQVHFLKEKIVNIIKDDGRFKGIAIGKWNLFERFINWCFNSEEEIDQFKVDISSHDKLENFVRHIIQFTRNIDFPQKFLVWVLSSETKIVRFKKKLFSQMGWAVSFRLVVLSLLGDSFAVSVKLLSEWFHPFEKQVLSELKLNKERFFHYCFDEEERRINSLFSLLESFIHEGEIGVTDGSDTGFNLDTAVGDSKGESGDCTDCLSSDHSSVFNQNGDRVYPLTGELMKGDFEDCDGDKG